MFMASDRFHLIRIHEATTRRWASLCTGKEGAGVACKRSVGATAVFAATDIYVLLKLKWKSQDCFFLGALWWVFAHPCMHLLGLNTTFLLNYFVIRTYQARHKLNSRSPRYKPMFRCMNSLSVGFLKHLLLYMASICGQAYRFDCVKKSDNI